MDRFILILLITAAIASFITYIMGRLFKNTKFVKYIPGTFMLLLSVYYFYMSRQPSQGFEDLAQFISAAIFFAAGLGGIITAIVMDYVKSRKR